MLKSRLPVLIPLLAAMVASGADQPGGGGKTLTPEEQRFWDDVQKDPALSQTSVAAQAKTAEARALFRAGRFLEARAAIEQAINIYPQNADAQHLREDILAVLGARSNRLQMVTAWMHAIQDVKTQEIAVRMAQLLDNGDKKMAAGDYSGAELDFDRVEVALRSFPYEFAWGDLPEKVAAKRLEARARARKAEIERQREDRANAERAARQRSEQEEQVLKANVDEILSRAHAAYDRKDFKSAEVSAWSAYELDRRREDARELYLAARRKGHALFDDDHRETRLEKLAQVHEEIHRNLIPQSELLVYPEDWSRRTLRKPRELGSNVEEPWMATIKNVMQQEISFRFEDLPFEEVIAFFRQTTGLNIIEDPAILASGGGTVNLTAANMKFKDALKWVLLQTNLHWAIQNQAIYISNSEVAGNLVLHLYPVTDLVLPIHDFPGREVGYGGSGAKGGFDLFGGKAAVEEKATSPQDLVDFIQNNVAKGHWDTPGVGIDIRSGSSLFVTQTPEIHAQIELLLANLRAQQKLQVNVSVRTLDVKKGFFEEIGFEYHDFPAGMIDTPNAVDGYRRLDGTESYTGDVRQALPANTTTSSYSAGGNGVYTHGLQIEGVYHINSFLDTDQVNAIFAAVEEETDAQLLEHPSITCFDGERAHADFLTQYAYISSYTVSNNNLDPEISVLTFGNSIDVKPVVSSDRKYITMEIRPTSVSLFGVFVELIDAPRVIGNNGGDVLVVPGKAPIELPNIVLRSMRSTVMMPDKGSLIIGGFQRNLRQRTHSGVPFLSHIPFLGRLFSRNGTYDEDRRLFFLLSAEIIDYTEKESLQ